MPGSGNARRPRPAPPSGSKRCGSSASRATRPPPSSRSPRRPRSPPRTFFRYFPTKEDVVLQDDVDVLTIEAFDAQPPDLSPVAAVRAAAATTFAELTPEELARLRETTELTLSVPEIRARAVDEFVRSIEVIAAAVARRTGHAPDDFAVRNLAGAVIGVIMASALTDEGRSHR